MGTLISLAVVVLVSRVLWFLLRDYVVGSPLDNIPGPLSKSLLTGNMLEFFSRDSWEFVQNLCETYGPVSKFHAFFGSRWLHVYDPKALHHILVKDGDSYYRGEQAISGVRLFFGSSLLGTYGVHHKKQRKMLNPVFSAAHMRDMTPMFYTICGKLRDAIGARIEDGPQELDLLGWMGRTALELVGQGGFGYSFDPIVTEPRDKFTDAVKAFVPLSTSITRYRPLFPYFKYMGPPRFRRFLLNLVPSKNIQKLKLLSDAIHMRSREIFEAKKRAIEGGDQELLHMIGEGKDILSVMLRENMLASEQDKLPEDELLAQLSTFIVAGVDTPSNALSRTLHLLALNSDVQRKLPNEVLEAQEVHGKEIPYDELSQLPYLDAICRETLRLYAPVSVVFRQTRNDTVLPLSQPIRGLNGRTISEIPMPKGTNLFINNRASNTNKALWGDDAYEWKPERWLQPLPRSVEQARIPGIYANLMTFIGGGHGCIGFKFSQLEMKIVLAILVASFQFDLGEKPIYWNFGGVSFPTTSRDGDKPEMFLSVSMPGSEASPARG